MPRNAIYNLLNRRFSAQTLQYVLVRPYENGSSVRQAAILLEQPAVPLVAKGKVFIGGPQAQADAVAQHLCGVLEPPSPSGAASHDEVERPRLHQVEGGELPSRDLLVRQLLDVREVYRLLRQTVAWSFDPNPSVRQPSAGPKLWGVD